MKTFLIIMSAVALLMSGGCEEALNPFFLAGGPQGEDTTNHVCQKADGNCDEDVTTTPNDDTTTTPDEMTPVDPCLSCLEDETCWDGTKCVSSKWATLVSEKIPGTWYNTNQKKSSTVELVKDGDDYILTKFPGGVNTFSAFFVDANGYFNFVHEKSGDHVEGLFATDAKSTFYLTYLKTIPGDYPTEFHFVRTSP